MLKPKRPGDTSMVNIHSGDGIKLNKGIYSRSCEIIGFSVLNSRKCITIIIIISTPERLNTNAPVQPLKISA